MNGWHRPPLLVAICMVIVAVLLFISVFARQISLYDISQLDLQAQFKPPIFLGGGWDHPFGTDALGRDIFTLLVRGIQLSLTIAVVGTIGGAVLGTSLGFVAARTGGVIDTIIGILVDFQATIPNLIFIIALITVLPSGSLSVFMIVMTIYGWERYARLARAIGLTAQSRAYVQAQQVIGASAFRVVTRCILPNFMGVLLVNMSLTFPQIILLETTLSFLGIGIQPPDTSLGVLIGDGRNQLFNAPWVVLFPGIVILLATISISLIGDWARDLVEND